MNYQINILDILKPEVPELCSHFDAAMRESKLSSLKNGNTTFRICSDPNCPLRAYSVPKHNIKPWSLPLASIFRIFPKFKKWATLPKGSPDAQCDFMNVMLPGGLLNFKTQEYLEKYCGVDVTEVGDVISGQQLPFIHRDEKYLGMSYPSKDLSFLFAFKVDHTISPDEIIDATQSALSEGATHYCLRTTKGRPYELNLLIDFLRYNEFNKQSQLNITY